MDMYCSDLLQDYIEYLEVERGRSTYTSENYALYLNRFIEFTDDITVDKITLEIIRKYRLWLNRYKNEQNLSLGKLTQFYHLVALRGFLNYLSKRDISSLSPNKIELPKISRKQVTFLDFDEIQRILEAIKSDNEPGLRDRAIIDFYFLAG